MSSCRSSPTDAKMFSSRLCHATSCFASFVSKLAQHEICQRARAYLDDRSVTLVDSERFERRIGFRVPVDIPMKKRIREFSGLIVIVESQN